MTSDPVQAADRYRQNSQSTSKQSRRDYGGLEDSALVPATITIVSAHEAAKREAERARALLGVCKVAIRLGCERAPGEPCGHPDHLADAAETGHVAGVWRVLYALGLMDEPGPEVEKTDEWGRRLSRERQRLKPGTPALAMAG